MQLIGIKVKHFRSLYETEWILFHDLTVLIGENDGGKTATLDTLEIFLGNRQPDSEDYSYVPGSTPNAQGVIQHEQEMLIDGQFKLTDPEKAEVLKFAPLQDGCLHVRKRFSLGAQPESFVIGQVPADPRLRIDLESAKIAELRNLARDLALQVGGTATQPFIDAIRTFKSGQPTTEGMVPFPNSIKGLLPEFTRFNSASDPTSVVTGVLRTIFKQELEKPENSGHLTEVQKNITLKLRQEAAALNPLYCCIP